MRLFSLTTLETKDVITFIGATIAVGIGLWQYHTTSRNEFLRPIREEQLKEYVEASGAAASLATLPPNTAEWQKAKADFRRLYFGPLAMFEDYQHQQSGGRKGNNQKNDEITVERAMIAFNSCLENKDCVGKSEMQDLSLALAHTCRQSLGSSWGFEASQLRGDYQDLIRKYETADNKPPLTTGQ